jgi:hypothetical protein
LVELREIKFRAWDELNRVMMEPETVGLFIHFDGTMNHHDLGIVQGTSNTPQMTLLQYTGLKDSNGKEIYEGDVVKSVALSNDHHQRGATAVSPVEYWCGNAVLSITYTPIYPFCLDHDIEIIGNIYEHPHLLKEASQC